MKGEIKYWEGNEQGQTMDQYGQAKIAEKPDCFRVDTQVVFNEVLKELYPAPLAWDRIHSSAAGHMVLARAFLKEMGSIGWGSQNSNK